MRRRVVAVIGGQQCDQKAYDLAYEVGKLIAHKGLVLVTGGLTGVMAAASQGASERGGLVMAIIPSDQPQDANPFADIVVATGMGDARNAIITNTAESFIAIDGSHGTLSEIAYALKRGKRVVSLFSWNVDPAVLQVKTPEEAVQLIERCP